MESQPGWNTYFSAPGIQKGWFFSTHILCGCVSIPIEIVQFVRMNRQQVLVIEEVQAKDEKVTFWKPGWEVAERAQRGGPNEKDGDGPAGCLGRRQEAGTAGKEGEGVQLCEPGPGFGTGDEGRRGPACHLPKKTSQVSVRMGTQPVSLGVLCTTSLHWNPVPLSGKQCLSFILSTF